MRILSLDIGGRRTGVAYLDTEVGIPLPLDTIEHATVQELIGEVMNIIESRRVDRVIVGMPLLLSGQEGSQARASRAVAERLTGRGIIVELRDERYTTPKGRPGKHGIAAKEFDGDAAAACALLGNYR